MTIAQPKTIGGKKYMQSHDTNIMKLTYCTIGMTNSAN